MFRDNLKDQINYKVMIIKELAAKTGISKRTIDTYVDNRAVIPNAEIAVKLANALDTTVEYLVTGKNNNSSNNKNDIELINKYRKMLLEFENLSPKMQTIIGNLIHEAKK